MHADANITENGNSLLNLANGGEGGNGATSNCYTPESYWAGGGAGWYTNGTAGNVCSNYSADPGIESAGGGLTPLNGGSGGLRWIDSWDEGGDGGFGGFAFSRFVKQQRSNNAIMQYCIVACIIAQKVCF